MDARLMPILMLGDTPRAFWVSKFKHFVVPGPGALKWYSEFLNRRGGGPRYHRQRCKTTMRGSEGAWVHG